MISKEEALTKTARLISDIYSSIGTCEECRYSGGSKCDIMDCLPEYKTRFCSEFKRKKNE